MKKPSAGLVMYRIRDSQPEVLLVHPGGPFYTKKDDGVWSIPKGEADDGETGDQLLDVAKREFEEETSMRPEGPFTYLAAVRRKDGKVIEAWTCKGDIDTSKLKSNMIAIPWPPRSGKMLEIPEVDRGEFFTLEEAKVKISPYMLGLLEAFEKYWETIRKN